MPTGQTVLRTLRDNAKQLRTKKDSLAATLGKCRDQALDLGQREQVMLSRLAHLRLAAIKAGETVDALRKADAQVKRTLAERARARAQNAGKVAEVESCIESAQARAKAARQASATATAEALDAIAKVRSTLRSDPSMRGLVEQKVEAVRTLASLKARREQAERDVTEHAAAYTRDPLFQYLWAQRYGRPGYRSRGLTCWLDGWVARLCRFRDTAPRYALLIRLPPLVAEQQKVTRETLAATLSELGAAQREGIQNGAAATRIATRRRLHQAALKARSEVLNDQHLLASLQAEDIALKAGSDRYTESATTCLEDAVSAADGPVLAAAVAESRTKEDDELLAALLDVRARKRAVHATMAAADKRLAAGKAHYEASERLVQEFKRRRYDTGRFDSDIDITDMASSYLAGSLAASVFWNNAERSHHVDPPPVIHYHDDDDSGFGGFGGGGFGGGGFSSGGGFGGGGFSTGGGF